MRNALKTGAILNFQFRNLQFQGNAKQIITIPALIMHYINNDLLESAGPSELKSQLLENEGV